MVKRLFSFKGQDNPLTEEELLLPKMRRDDDIFIVSFPKSGNTWISFILANIIVERLNLDMEVNFFNFSGFIPNIHQGRQIPLDLGYFPFKRMIKSHASFQPGYKFVIYVLRDPRSVMVSYYRYLTGLGFFSGDMSSLIRSKEYGIDAWVFHVQNWLDRRATDTRFAFIKYEDFKAHPENSINNLARLIGVLLPDDVINRIQQRTSFETMQQLEASYRNIAMKNYDAKYKFIRSGTPDGWKAELSREDILYIERQAAALMSKLGYE